MIVGIDPGLRHPAMACVDRRGTLLWIEVLDGIERAPVEHPLWQRCAIVADWARSTLIAKLRGVLPRVFIEDAAYNKRFQADSMGASRQAIYDRVLSISKSVEPVGIQEAKKALAGNGHAKKADMQVMAQRIASDKFNRFQYATKPEREAAADAFGIALAGLAKIREEELSTKRMVEFVPNQQQRDFIESSDKRKPI